MRITGDAEVVFDWTTEHCIPENIPDLAARAFRDASGTVHLILSHHANYQMLGPDLDHVKVDCNEIFGSDQDADPSHFNDEEWIASPYTEDGQTIYALVHDEYQGHTHPGQCPSGDYFDCLDTSLTVAVSRDGGNTYEDALPPPADLVATLPSAYQAGAGPFGIRNPSNIIKGKDGYYYAYMNISQYLNQQQWVCAMRTQDLSDPKSWRFWDGSGFNGEFIDPYAQKGSTPGYHACAALAIDQIGASLNDSITYNTYLNKYVLIGNSADHLDGREVWGWYYAFSDDLLHWTRRELLAEEPLPWTVGNPGSDVSVLYPSLLDPASESRNFETTGRTAYVYFTRMNYGQGHLDRDLVRVPVEFAGSP
jgi:hypothetical protein